MVVAATFFSSQAAQRSGADTDPSTLVGEGGSFLSPVTNLLLNSDSALHLYPAYSDANLDNAIADFAGTGPGQFNADFVVSERPLTTAEATQATSDGRTFAYVPIAATPVAIATLDVCNPADIASGVASPSTFCQHIPLTPTLVGELFTSGFTNPLVQPNAGLPTTLAAWNDARLTQSNGTAIPDGNGIGVASTLAPSAENSTLISLIDSDPTARVAFDNALNNPANGASTTSDVPSEIWPLHPVHAFVGGDEGLIGHELTIIAATNAPSFLNSWGGLENGVHDAFAVSAVWTGAPLGTPWNVPTAAIENASGAFVPPTEAAAAAAEADATLDPTTNLVTFNASKSDAAAYNNYLMAESYLVVPLTGLPPAKATALAQFVRFALGQTGASYMEQLGAAPPTPAMVTAGLKVASELNAEAASGLTSVATTSTTTTTTTVGATTSTTTTTVAKQKATKKPAKKKKPGAAPGAATTTTFTLVRIGSSGSGPTLAFTGADPWPLVYFGAALLFAAESFRRMLRRGAKVLRVQRAPARRRRDDRAMRHR